MHLFGRSTSVNVQKVLWTIEEIGVACELVELGGAFGGLDNTDYGAMNPNRRVPTLIDGDLTLWESNAIVRYLANSYGNGKLAGSNSQDIARADMWMEWFQNNCYAHYITLFHQTVRMPKSHRDPIKRDQAAISLTNGFEILDAHLADHKFVAGDRLSMGDIVIGASLYRYYDMDIQRANLPELAAYYERLSQRAGYQKTIMTSYESLLPKEV